MFSQHDVECMSRALHLAKRGIYTTRPNPNVGCVITDTKGEVVGQGFHQKAGEAHAEIMALEQAGSLARHGTAYITLEPCCHQGRTGPCTQALIESGIKKVFVAMEDPNPQVSGKGIAILRQHDIEVVNDCLGDQAMHLNRGFIKRMSTGMPLVTLKIATSADGRTALKNGLSKWITSAQSRHDVQKLRACHDAILTGIGTVLADDPGLNMRLENFELGIEGPVAQPLRVIIDPGLEMPVTAKILQVPGDTVIFTGCSVNADYFNKLDHCNVIRLDSQQGKFDLKQVLRQLADLEINSVMVEAGASLLGALINDKLADELVHYIAPSLLGNLSRGMFDIHEITAIDKRVDLQFRDIRHVGKDIRVTSLITY